MLLPCSVVLCPLILLCCSYSLFHSVINMIILQWLSFVSLHQYLASRRARGSPSTGDYRRKATESKGGRWRWNVPGSGGRTGKIGNCLFVTALPSFLQIPRARGTKPFPLVQLAAISSSSLPLFSLYPTGGEGKCPIHTTLKDLSSSSEKDSACLSWHLLS